MVYEEIEEKNDTGLLVATFKVGEAWFGLDANRVQEVVQVKKNTPVHHAPNYIRGVMNLRGRVISIIDIGEKLCLGSIRKNDENRILIIEWKQEYIGLLVERVEEVIQIENESIRVPPGNVHGVQSTLISGVFQNDSGNLLGLLDIDKILEIEEQNFNESQNSK